MAWNPFWGRHLANQLHRPTGGLQLGLQIHDPLARGDELSLFDTRQAGHQAAVNPVLATPPVDRLVTDLQVGSHVRDRPPSLEQIQNLPAKLRRVPTSS